MWLSHSEMSCLLHSSGLALNLQLYTRELSPSVYFGSLTFIWILREGKKKQLDHKLLNLSVQ